MKTKRRRGVRVRRWTKEEYYRLGELGFFQGQRVELIEGRLMVMSPQNAPHWTAIERVRRRLATLFEPGAVVRMQGPIDLGQTTEPEPDIAVVVGTLDQYAQAHPKHALLIVEVSDSTLHDDRRKGGLYARAGITDYWIVNVEKKQLKVYRDPVPDAAQPFGWKSASRTDLKAPATVSPLILPGQSIAVADLVP